MDKMRIFAQLSVFLTVFFVLGIFSPAFSARANDKIYIDAGDSSVGEPLVTTDLVEENSSNNKISREPYVASILVYKVVIKGDNLSRMARRFGVEIEDLVSENPGLAKRKNKWLYLNETIRIPVYKPDEKVLSSVLPEKIVLMAPAELAVITDQHAKSLAVADKKVEEVKGEESTRMLIAILVIVFFVILLLLVLLGNKYGSRRLYESIVSETTESKKVNFENSSPEELLEALRTARWHVLVSVSDMPLAHDENGNPTTLKKAKEFVGKRHFISGLTVNQSAEVIKARKNNPGQAEKTSDGGIVLNS